MDIQEYMIDNKFEYAGNLTDDGLSHMKNLDMLIHSEEACCFDLNNIREFDYLISIASDEQVSKLKYTVIN